MFNTKKRIMKISAIVLFLTILCFQLYGQEIKTTNDPFYFVQITDTHIGKGTNLEITRNLVKQINELPMYIKCVIHTGDILQDGMSDTTNVIKAFEALEKLEAPLYYIPGNHDIFQEYAEKEITIFQEYFGDLIVEIEFELIKRESLNFVYLPGNFHSNYEKANLAAAHHPFSTTKLRTDNSWPGARPGNPEACGLCIGILQRDISWNHYQ